MDNMKFTGKNTPKGVRIPAPVLNINGFGGGESVELHAMKEAVVVLKQYMNAKELAWAIHGLQKLALELSLYLFEVCGKCEDCGDDCPYIRELYKDCYILAFKRDNPMAQKKNAEYGELIITNYDPRPYMTPQFTLFAPTVDVGREMTLVNDPGYSLRDINLKKKGKLTLWTT